MSMQRRIALAGTVTVAGLALAACGSAGSGAAKTRSQPQVPAAATAPAPVQSPPAQSPSAGRNWKGRLVLSTAPNATLDTTVVDGKVPAPAGGSGDQGYSSY
jgi:hypothetical protein